MRSPLDQPMFIEFAELNDIHLGKCVRHLMYEVPSHCAKKFSQVNVTRGEYLEPMNPNCLRLGIFTLINPVN